MEKFLSCDWGTSALRLRLVDTAGLNILAEKNSSKGVLGIFNAWNQETNGDQGLRVSFYLDILKQHVQELESSINHSLDEVPLVISGMASSTVGIMPLPYVELPFSTTGAGITTERFPSSKEFPHRVLLISGVKSEDDVMRGEETQLIGLSGESQGHGLQTFIFPGTHSKHIVVNGHEVTGFKTFMTGEFFDLLSNKSILHSNVQKNDGPARGNELQSFEKGVRDSAGSNLLQVCFRVRTNDLFQVLSKTDNYYYLSGLLIGTELRELLQNDSIMIYLCSGSGLKIYYEKALHVLGLGRKVSVLTGQSVDEAVIKGQYKIYQQQVNND
ncbi:MAG TPA: 2-dehydro-3-deoxygalactonokinase [Chitinophagaceae bacterium]|nr:2-dehydro-3-deoxygalactonokinase [Chitinophagaceae bacterium]